MFDSDDDLMVVRPIFVKCPRCGSAMVERIAQRGSRAGNAFYGCSSYPGCTGTLPKPVGDAMIADAKKAIEAAKKARRDREIAAAKAEDLDFLVALELD